MHIALLFNKQKLYNGARYIQNMSENNNKQENVEYGSGY